MSSVARSIKRGVLFSHTNKQQKKIWSSLPALRKREYEKEVGKEIRINNKFGNFGKNP